MSRGRSYGQNRDWDPMRDDFDDSTYDAQYQDDEAGNEVHLDHRRLYITNIPKALNDEGLRTAFSKYGTLTEVHISKDPTKRYGLVAYETPGEAKLAMMKLNRTEPLKLNISIAHKKKTESRTWERVNGSGRDRTHWDDRDGSSICSRRPTSRKQEGSSNAGDPIEEGIGDELDLTDTLDPDLHLELEHLKLQQLKIQEQEIQCKQRMLLLKEATKRPSSQSFTGSGPKERSFLPDGRIVVRNVDKASDSRDPGEGYTGGAGDARAASRHCVSCARVADNYCAGCGITPYCSDVCQKRDWEKRHSSICHNLAKFGVAKNVPATVENDAISPTANAPLRRPHQAKPVQNTNVPSEKTNMQEKRADQQSSVQDNFKNKSRLARLTNRSGNQDSNGGHFENTNGNRDNNDKNRRSFNKTGKDNRVSAAKTINIDDEDNENWGSVKPKPVTQPAPTVKAAPVQVKTPPAEAEPVKLPATEQKKMPMLSVADVTPAKKTVPKNYVPELLKMGDDVIMCVEDTLNNQFICSCMHEAVQEDFQSLMDDYTAECEADVQIISPQPGAIFSLRQPDGAWYRARMLNATNAALIDASKIVPVNEPAKKISTKYANIPEFCCALTGDVKVGDNLQCTLQSKTSQGFKVLIKSLDTGAAVGEGVISRWTLDVEYPKPVISPAVTTEVAEIPRPALINNSKVILVEAATLQRALVLDVSKQKEYDYVLQNGAIVDNPLKTPPQKGQVVISKFTDGLCYRALCKRTNVKMNKYLVEYIEFGNEEKTTLENLHECPPELNLENAPCFTSLVKISDDVVSDQAAAYIAGLKDDGHILILTLGDGVKSAPSGSEATLTLEKNKENVNKKLKQLCTPEWKKINDVLDLEPLMYAAMQFPDLPLASCELDVFYMDNLNVGMISACLKDDKSRDFITGTLTERITEYCNSDIGKEPYLPMPEELCIAQWDIDETWYRGVVLEQVSGAGGQYARVMFLDYGNTELVHVKNLRKMLPEFVNDVPAGIYSFDIHDFPVNPTNEQLTRALQFMNVNDEGRGILKVDMIEKQNDEGMYTAYCKGLIAAMNRDL